MWPTSPTYLRSGYSRSLPTRWDGPPPCHEYSIWDFSDSILRSSYPGTTPTPTIVGVGNTNERIFRSTGTRSPWTSRVWEGWRTPWPQELPKTCWHNPERSHWHRSRGVARPGAAPREAVASRWLETLE